MADPVPSSPEAPTPAADPLIGRVINERFKVLSLIARGGMGKVYRAEQTPLGRVVALKVLTPTYAGENDPEFHRRFFLEASVVSKLTHPNTVTLYDYGHTPDGVYFMAMEYLEGRTLHRLLREEAPVEPLRALHIVAQACRAVREAHALGVIHRDLKPANVFLVRHDDDLDFVKVLDFGLLKRTGEAADEALTQTGLFMGSPKYIAPEQIRGEPVSPATDVYSLGVMLYEMLTGKVPFERTSSVNLLMAHVNDPVPSMGDANPLIDVPDALEDIVQRCLAKHPEDRFATTDDLLAALKGVSAMLGRPFGTASGEFASVRSVRPSALERSAPRATLPPPLPSARPAAVAVEAAPEPLASSESTASRPRIPRAAMLLGLLIASVAVGAIARSLFHHPASPPSVTATVTTVTLDSDPPGADVLEDGVSLGHTPLRTTWTGDRGAPGRTHALLFRHAGFDDLRATVSGASIAYRARLVAAVADPAVAPTPAVPASPTTDVEGPPRAVRRVVRPRVEPAPAAHPPGYRDNVY